MTASTASDLLGRIDERQHNVRFATEFSPALAGSLRSLVTDAGASDPGGAAWVRAVSLFAYALVRWAQVRNSNYADIMSALRRAASQDGPAEVMAARWILGRAYLSYAASLGLSLPGKLQHTRAALDCFSRIETVRLSHPILLPGVAAEYPDALLDRHDPGEIDPPVTYVHPPYRYLIATAAALMDLAPNEHRTLLAQAATYAERLRSVHSGAIGARLNADLALAAAVALTAVPLPLKPDALRRNADAIHRRIEDASAAELLTARKSLEWRASAHAVATLHAETSRDREEQFSAMGHTLHQLVQRHYKHGLPDFTMVDAVYARAYRLVCGHDSLSYREFLWRLLRRV